MLAAPAAGSRLAGPPALTRALQLTAAGPPHSPACPGLPVVVGLGAALACLGRAIEGGALLLNAAETHPLLCGDDAALALLESCLAPFAAHPSSTSASAPEDGAWCQLARAALTQVSGL